MDHVHPRGWLSSACYIALPPAICSGVATDSGMPDRAGWLRFGRPGIPTDPALAPDHFVRPEPGLLALFPAYVWHGVEPFVSDQPRADRCVRRAAGLAGNEARKQLAYRAWHQAERLT